MAEQPEPLSKQAFLDLAAQLGLPGDEARMDELYAEVNILLLRASTVYDVDTTGIEPSPINPQFDVANAPVETPQ